MISKFTGWPCFSQEEIQAVQDVIASNKVNYWTGSNCRSFENEFATWSHSKHSVALSNGTVALDLALNALGIGPGMQVVVTPRTFVASVFSIVNCGAEPVFADIDRNSGNITADTIKSVLTTRTRAIVLVHLGGYPCDMDPIMELANRCGLKVIEDCAQAHGAIYKGRPVGSIGHVGAWSFCQDKIMTTGGEGGMVTTNDETLWRRMWSFKDHGKSYEAVYERDHPPGFRWLHESFGTNWRMMEIQAVIGRIQLKRMSDWTQKRTKYALAIWNSCMKYPVVRVPVFDDWSGETLHAHYKCYVYVEPKNLAEGWSRDRIIDAINEQGVPCYQGSCSEVYLEKAFDDTGWRPKDRLPVARELGETSLMFLVHPTLTDAEIQKTCDVLENVLKQACR